MPGLTAIKVKTLTRPGRYGDGGGLYLQVRDASRKSWLFRYKIHGRARQMGLGAIEDVSLAEARDKAAEARRLLRAKPPVDPLETRRTAEAQARSDATGMSFLEVAERYIDAHAPGWRNAKHRAQWCSTLQTFAYPVIGALHVKDITTGHLTRILAPLWQGKTETASRLRGRIERVLDYAGSHGWRTGENPARWRGHLANLLPKRSKVQTVKHHPALPWKEIAAFMAQVQAQEGMAARALAFLILTAARTGEVLGARWGEVDPAAGVWTVPGERMKAGRAHRVPLAPAALAVLAGIQPAADLDPDAFVFPGARARRPLSNMAMLQLLARMQRDDITPHGFRSTFRDWCAEATAYPREVAEMALAHTLKDKVEAAYRRGDLFEKRRRLMEDWAIYCTAGGVQADAGRTNRVAGGRHGEEATGRVGAA